MPDTTSPVERLAELRRRWEEDPSSPVFLKLAEEHRRAGQTDEALKVLEAGLAKNPTYLSAQVARGRCLLDLGRTAEAVAALEPVLDRDATQLVARKLVVEAHVRQGAALRARRQLDLYASLNPGDSEIESLRDRIQDLLLADAAPWRPPVPVVEAEAVVATPLTPHSPIAFDPEIEPARPAPVAAPPLDGRDPFPELGRVDRRRYLDGLAAEGIFSRPEVDWTGEELAIAEEAASVETDLDRPLSAEPAAVGALDDEPDTWAAAEPAVETRLADAPTAEAPAADAPVEEPSVPGPEDETLPFIAPRVADGAGPAPATATLGELYLRQGHHGEAERIFLAVLRHDPGNVQAKAGLEALARARDSAAAEAGEGETAARRKVLALKRYLSRLRGGVEHNVS